MSNEIKKVTAARKAVYSKPKLEIFGRVSAVTQKTGANTDSNQSRKSGGGGG